MRGASALEQLLREMPSKGVRVFVVWEPILPSDWQRPTNPILAKVSDPRASQYWDEGHLVAKLVRESTPAGQPNCCDKDGVLWDLVAVYPKGASLSSTPAYIAGPVVKAANGAKQRMAGM